MEKKLEKTDSKSLEHEIKDKENIMGSDNIKSDEINESKTDNISFNKSNFYISILFIVVIFTTLSGFLFLNSNINSGIGGNFLNSEVNDSLNNLEDLENLKPLIDEEKTKNLDEKSLVIAIYNGKELNKNDFDKDVDISLFLQGAPENYRDNLPYEELVNEMILINVLADNARDLGFLVNREELVTNLKISLIQSGTNIDDFKLDLETKSFDFDELIDFYVNQQSINNYLENLTSSNLEIKDQDILEYYTKNIETFKIENQIKASHILVEKIEKANEVITKLDAGADFAKLAVKYSIGPSNSTGGDLGFFGKGAMVPEFEAAAFDLEKIGDYSKEAVKTQFGFHIIKLVDIKEGGDSEFEDVKDKVKETLINEKKSKISSEKIDEIFKNIVIELK